MNLLFAAASGYGKSYHCQAFVEENTENYDHLILLDYKDEYRGLVKAGFCKHWLIGQREHTHFTTRHWRELLAQNPRLVLARQTGPDGLDIPEWRETCGRIVGVLDSLEGSVLVVVDEAHWVAPQREQAPDPITSLATTGRGEKKSAMWVTQRITEIEETVIAQCTARMLGGFESDNDLKKIKPVLDYPARAHKTGGHRVPGLPDDLHAPDEGAISVRKWTETNAGQTRVTASEWLWSDDAGNMDRVNTGELSMQSQHVGASGKTISRSSYG